MQRPFRRNCNEEHKVFNRQMSSVLVCVEHSYKDLKQQFISQDFSRNLKVRQSPIALQYKASALLWNFRLCFYK